MNLLLVNYEYPPLGGGASNATWKTAEALLAEGHEVSVLSQSFQELHGYKNEAGLHVYRVRGLRRNKSQSNVLEMFSFLPAAALKINRIIKKHSIEGIIYYFTIPTAMLAPYVRLKQKIPYIVSLRGGDVPGLVKNLNPVHWLLKPLRRHILRKAKQVIANSVSLKTLSEKGDPKIPVGIIPNGVDCWQFHPSLNGSVPKKAFTLLFVGRLHDQKNLHFLLRAAGAVNSRGASFQLEIVGDGPLRKDLTDYVRKLGLEKLVKWRGWAGKEELAEIYNGADCFINPSLYEGMPNVVLEAMASGLPVIASHIPGNDELVVHEKTGFLFDLERQEELESILEYCIKEHVKIKSMGHAGRELVEQEFTWAAVSRKYAEILHDSGTLVER